jgi:hypothetical protein
MPKHPSNDDDQYSPEETARRMERGLRRALSTPPQLHGKNPKSPPPKRKERPASKGRVHKGKARNSQLISHKELNEPDAGFSSSKEC